MFIDRSPCRLMLLCFCSWFFLLALSGCTPRPIYKPPSDRFGLSNPQYLKAIAAIEGAPSEQEEAQDVNSAPSTNEEVVAGIEALSALVGIRHPPSMVALSKLYIGMAVLESQGFRNLPETAGAEARQTVEQNLLRGFQLLTEAARYGYPEAVSLLTKNGLEPPEVTLKPPAVLRAQAAHKAQLAEYEQGRQQLKELLLGALAAGAMGASSYYATRNNPPGAVAGSRTSSAYGFVPNNGNNYITSPGANGSTYVSGWNNNTGSRWNQTIQGDGDQSGFDSNGNYWTYDAQTSRYYNYGTGRTCIGQGALRSCF